MKVIFAAMISIVIYDDHAPRRDALKLLISLQQDMMVTGDYDKCTEIISDLAHNTPTVVLMDIDMPGMSGIEAVRLVRKNYPETLVIMQTVFEDDDKILDSIIAGAHGYFLKKTPPEKLIEGIREVTAGGAPMTATIARRVLELFKQQSPKSTEENFDLSLRELEILSHLVKGLSHKMIAAQLKISKFTVSNHIKNIYQKLQVHSVSEAVSAALQKKIV